jgi:hypothetical protein
MPQLKQLDEKIHDTIPAGKYDDHKIAATDTYVIYSIYFADKPHDGHVIYSKNKQGWDFFGYLPAGGPAQLSQQRKSCREFDCL